MWEVKCVWVFQIWHFSASPSPSPRPTANPPLSSFGVSPLSSFGDAPERRQQAYSDFESPASSDEATALMSVQDAPPQQRNVKLIGALSNLSIQYNFSAIAIALAFMDNTGGNKSSSEPAAAYPRTEAQAALLKSLVFAGASNRRCRALLRRGRCCAAPASRCH